MKTEIVSRDVLLNAIYRTARDLFLRYGTSALTINDARRQVADAMRSVMEKEKSAS